jgi:hypothetical protein
MIWKLFTFGFFLDSRTIRKLEYFMTTTCSADSQDFTHKYTKTSENTSLQDILEKSIKDKQKTFFSSGLDERYNHTEIIFNITNFVYQMNLLRKLESDAVSQAEKLAAIDRYERERGDGGYLAQIKNGGLWKDWQGDIDGTY